MLADLSVGRFPGVKFIELCGGYSIPHHSTTHHFQAWRGPSHHICRCCCEPRLIWTRGWSGKPSAPFWSCTARGAPRCFTPWVCRRGGGGGHRGAGPSGAIGLGSGSFLKKINGFCLLFFCCLRRVPRYSVVAFPHFHATTGKLPAWYQVGGGLLLLGRAAQSASLAVH